MIKAQLLNKGSYSTRVVTLKTFIESYRHQTRVVTCWTLLQKENVKYKFLICRAEVYPKAHEAVNKTKCYIVKSVKVTLSDLLCSLFSCLCWCNLRGKESKNMKILKKRVYRHDFAFVLVTPSDMFYLGSVKLQHRGRAQPSSCSCPWACSATLPRGSSSPIGI